MKARADARPLVVVVDLVTSVGGVQQVMFKLLPPLLSDFRVEILDPYQNPDYARMLDTVGLTHGGLGLAPRRRYVGGRNWVTKSWRLTNRAPWLITTGLLLRRWVSVFLPDVVYFNQLPSARYFARFLPWHGPALVYHAHGFPSTASVKGAPYISRRFRSVLAVSRATARHLIDAGVDQGKVTVVHNAVDIEEVQRRSQVDSILVPARIPGAVVFVHVAVVGPHKGQRVSVDALSRLPASAHLWICGDVADGGDRAYLDHLRRYVSRLGLDERVLFLGWRRDVQRVVASADALILPSVSEGSPMVLVEAMALGKPCIGSDVGGVPEIIEDGVSGFVVERNPSALATAMARLHDSPSMREAMGRAGLDRVSRLFSLSRQVEQVREILRLAQSDRPSRHTRSLR